MKNARKGSFLFSDIFKFNDNIEYNTIQYYKLKNKMKMFLQS